MSRRLTLLCVAKLQPRQLERHLEPLELCGEVDRILLVRHTDIRTRLSKVEHIGFADRGRVWNAITMYRRIVEVLRRERVDWVLGMNPIPWGSIAWAAAASLSVPMSLSLLGSDYHRLMHPLSRPLWLPLRRAQLVTVPGRRMRQALVSRGLAPDRVKILPHVIDTARFSPSPASPAYDIVFVGQLVPVKRVDVLIDAVAKLRERGRGVRVAIVGRGPLDARIRASIARRGLHDTIDVLGFREDVETVLQCGRIFALTSDSEGLPFALIEAMSCGLVPVVTRVGAIEEIVQDGENGYLVPPGNPQRLAEVLDSLLADPSLLVERRQRALAIRNKLSMDVGVEFWRGIFGQARE